MANGFPRREEFDPRREFVVAISFLLNGRQIPVSEHFDKSKCPPRLLRQLYESRKLAMLDKVVEEEKGPVRPVFANLPIEALRDWLSENGVIPRAGATQQRLAMRCEKRWDELHGVKAAA